MTKPTIDERLEALTHSLELFQAEQAEYARQQKELDRRERKARAALMAGMAAYFQALNDNHDQEEETE